MHHQSLAVYIHVPFCTSKCHYCDFVSYAGVDHLRDPYVDAVCRESAAFQSRQAGTPIKARSIYIGGGTPSLLSAAQISRLLSALPVSEGDAEITIEANPATVSSDWLRAVNELGVKRLSLGAQTFDDVLLRRIGRRHSAWDIAEGVEDALKAGFAEISLDLIFGLPDQSLAGWQDDLRRAIDLQPQHLSLYGLTIEEGTLFGRLHGEGKLTVPDDDQQADMYEAACDVLGSAGFEHYEISNWARKTAGEAHYAQHNLVYWRNEPYVGFGAAAHSYFRGQRWANDSAVDGYMRMVEAQGDAIVSSEQVDRWQEMAETMMLGLRLTAGVDHVVFANRFGCRIEDAFGPIVDEVVALGLLSIDHHHAALTPRGRLLGNEVFRRFVSASSDARMGASAGGG